MTFTWRNDYRDRNAEFFSQSDNCGANAYVNWAACVANTEAISTYPVQYIVECWSKVTFRKIDRI